VRSHPCHLKWLRVSYIVLAACGDNNIPPDAHLHDVPIAAPACPVSTWRDALVYWDELRCTAIARCFPVEFVAWYGDYAGCVAEVGALHCLGGIPDDWCDWPYPTERCELLLKCKADSEAIACDPYATVPKSCQAALR
jgi:hypothetical protein